MFLPAWHFVLARNLSVIETESSVVIVVDINFTVVGAVDDLEALGDNRGACGTVVDAVQQLATEAVWKLKFKSSLIIVVHFYYLYY